VVRGVGGNGIILKIFEIYVLFHISLRQSSQNGTCSTHGEGEKLEQKHCLGNVGFSGSIQKILKDTEHAYVHWIQLAPDRVHRRILIY
jgi:hypothetical protein